MSSTRNINYVGNYAPEQTMNTKNMNYSLYENSACGYAYNTMMPGNGVNPGQIPNSKLSHNAVDVESFLFGIQSTNLVAHPFSVQPDIANLSNANFFTKKETVSIPMPLVITKAQRPNIRS